MKKGETRGKREGGSGSFGEIKVRSEREKGV